MKNNEFKVTKVKDATVYTLESASAGGTSSGSIASVASPMGGVRKRGDNLIAQEDNKTEAPKPRNFVAKNAKMGGAGQHKDKKKEMKQGVAKHKKPYMEEMDDLKSQFMAMLKDKGIKHRVQGSPDQERQRTKDMIAQRDAPSQSSAPSTSSAYRDGFRDGLRGHRNPRASNIHGPMSNDYDSGYHAGAMKKEKGAAEAFNPNSVNAKHAADVKAHHRAELKKKADAGDENAKARLAKAEKNDTDRRAEFDFNMNREGVAEGWGMGGYSTAIGSEIQPGKGHEMGENDEYDGEGSMIKNDLHTIVRVSTHLAKELSDDENLPTWVIEKIAQTKGMIVSVMDYMISQHEMGQVYQKENHPDEKEDKALIRKMVKQQALKQETNDPYMMELQARLAEKIPKNAPVKTYIDDFTKAAKTPNAKGHHQFKNKSPEKVRQMAIAASYGAKNPSKKKK